MTNLSLAEGESMMAWLERRINQTDDPSTIRTYQKKFVEMWKQNYVNTQDIPQDFKDKVERKWWEALNNPRWK